MVLKLGKREGRMVTVVCPEWHYQGKTQLLSGEGNGPIDAAVNALRGLNIALQVRSYEERSMGSSTRGGDATACAFVELLSPGSRQECYGVGIDANIVTASLKALLSGVNRLGAAAFIATEGSKAA